MVKFILGLILKVIVFAAILISGSLILVAAGFLLAIWAIKKLLGISSAPRRCRNCGCDIIDV